MKMANKKGENDSNTRNNSPFKKANNGNQWKPNQQNFKGSKNTNRIDSNQKAWQQGKNSSNPAANNAKKFGGNNDAEAINSMTKKHGNDLSDEDFSGTSESEDEGNEGEHVKMQTSNISKESDTSGSEDEVDASDNEEKLDVSANSNEMETSSEEVEKGDADEQKLDKVNRQAPSIFFRRFEDDVERDKQNARTIQVRNLTPSIKERHLQQVFSKYGKIQEISVFISANSFRKRPSAFILFENEEDAQKSLEAHGMKYQGNFILVETRNYNIKTAADQHVVFVMWTIGLTLSSFMEQMEAFGLVKQLQISKGKDCATVYFESADSVELAIAAGKICVGPYTLYIGKDEASVKTPIQHKQRGFKDKRPVEQSTQPSQYQQNIESSIQIHKSTLDDSVTITFNKSGSQPSQLGQKKQHKVKTGFVQKKKLSQAV